MGWGVLVALIERDATCLSGRTVDRRVEGSRERAIKKKRSFEKRISGVLTLLPTIYINIDFIAYDKSKIFSGRGINRLRARPTNGARLIHARDQTDISVSGGNARVVYRKRVTNTAARAGGTERHYYNDVKTRQ